MLFDPHAPIRFHIGAELKAKYKLLPSNSISGSFKQPLAGTMDDVKRGPKIGLPNVDLILCIIIEILVLAFILIILPLINI